MHEIIQFAQSATPLMILAIAVIGLVYAIYKLSKGEDLITKVNKVQDERTTKADELTRITLEFTDAVKKFEETLAYSNKIATNHTHELPEMKQQINALGKDVGDMKVNLAEINTSLKFIIKDK